MRRRRVEADRAGNRKKDAQGLQAGGRHLRRGVCRDARLHSTERRRDHRSRSARRLAGVFAVILAMPWTLLTASLASPTSTAASMTLAAGGMALNALLLAGLCHLFRR
jgi:hypothetical protein